MPYPGPRPRPPTQQRCSCGALLLSLSLLGGLLMAGCRGETPVTTSRFSAFGATVDLSLVGVNPAQAQHAATALKQDFELMHRAWHAWDPGPMGRVNQLLPKGEAFVAPPSVMPLVRIGKLYAERSGGLFSPAIGHLMDLWGFHTDTPECQPPPSRQAIERLVKANPQMSDIQIQGLELRGTNPALKLDFGAITKGYAIDLAIEALRELGVRHALVQIGGTLRAIGHRSGQPWRVAIRRASGSGVLAILMTRSDEAVATVAAYDRNFIYGGTTYHHILDPRTGWPARDTLAVTVAHGDATTAEAAATALFVAGPERWHEVARAMGVPFVLLVDSRGSLHMSPRMQERLELMDPGAEVHLSPPPDPTETEAAAGMDSPQGTAPRASHAATPER